MINLETQEDKDRVSAAFQNLINSEGWQLLVEIWDANIDSLREQLESDEDGKETLEDVRVLRNHLKLMREIKDTPQSMIQKINAPEADVPDPDPFDDISDVKERKKKRDAEEVDNEA